MIRQVSGPGSHDMLLPPEACRPQRACSLVGAGVDLGWLMLVFCEKKTLLAGWFELAETNQRTG